MGPRSGLGIFGEKENLVEDIAIPKICMYFQENAVLFAMLLLFLIFQYKSY
jgi:ascorbate-specific PTS system EIIC-type component UlaA